MVPSSLPILGLAYYLWRVQLHRLQSSLLRALSKKDKGFLFVLFSISVLLTTSKPQHSAFFLLPRDSDQAVCENQLILAIGSWGICYGGQ